MNIIIFLLYVFVESALSVSRHPVLIVVSYDAFRFNYFNKQVTPYMAKLRKEGTHAEYLENVFPTKTYPNHHSISTGLYPEVHGVIGNNFFDPNSKIMVKMGYDMFHYNEDIEPIWMLNERMGNGRYSGVMMWPGSGFAYQNNTPTYMQRWDPNYDFFARVDTIISWLIDDENPANLVMLYIEEPDTHGHAYGPNSQVVLNTLRKLDNVTAYLHMQLKANNLEDIVNVIHLSDHGMSTVRISEIVNLKHFLTPNSYTLAGCTPFMHVIPKEGIEEEVYHNLETASAAHHFRVFRKYELLERWHLKNNPRTPPILVLADVGYGFQDMLDNINFYEKKYKYEATAASEFGVHGYDNRVPEMRPFFMAHGPKIKKNHKVHPFKTVDLFNLFCRILEIKGPNNNGTMEMIEDILIPRSKMFSTIITIVGGVLLALLLVTVAVVITILAIKRQQTVTTTAALNKRFQQNFQHSVIEAQHLLEPEDA